MKLIILGLYVIAASVVAWFVSPLAELLWLGALGIAGATFALRTNKHEAASADLAKVIVALEEIQSAQSSFATQLQLQTGRFVGPQGADKRLKG